MNREDIIRMAREATKEAPREDWNSTAWVFGDETLERFAALVRKDYSTTHANLWLDRIHKFVLEEREACAEIVDNLPRMNGKTWGDAIRARGNVATNDTSQERVDETSKNVQKPCVLECDCTDVCKQVDYKALWQQMCERCDELDKRLSQSEQAPMNYYRADAKGNLERTDIHSAQPEQDWIERERAVGYREGHQNALKQMAQPEQEPVAWANLNALSEQINSVNCGTVYRLPSEAEGRQPLYTTPSQRTWVWLTDEEIDKIYEAHHNQYGECESVNFGYERAIEAKLRSKNNDT